jgi:hypothetical protein
MKDQDLVKPDGIDRVIDYLVGNFGEMQRAWKRVPTEAQTLEKYPAWALRHLLGSPWVRRFTREDKHLINQALERLDNEIQVAKYLEQFHQDPEWNQAHRKDCGRWLRGFSADYLTPPRDCWELRQAFFSTEAFMLALEKDS